MSEKIIKKITLDAPVTIAGEKTSEINIYEPTTKMFREIGFPFNISMATADFDMKKMGQYIAKCTDLTESDLDNISIGDFMAIGMEIGNFLGLQMAKIAPAVPVN